MRTADPELFQDKIEVSLDGRQIFYLFFGGAVVACLVFVLGVMVGKRLEARSHVSAPAADTLRDPLAALDQLNAREAAGELAFPAALTGDGPVDDPLLEAAVAAEAKAGDEGDEAGALAPAAGGSPPIARPDARPAKAAPAKAADRRRADDDESESTSAGARGQATAGESGPPARGRKARFTLQLSSFQDPGEANSFRAKLQAAGYKPYTVEAEVPDKGTWFRVRLGKFESYDDAIAEKKKFEADQHVIAYVTRL